MKQKKYYNNLIAIILIAGALLPVLHLAIYNIALQENIFFDTYEDITSRILFVFWPILIGVSELILGPLHRTNILWYAILITINTIQYAIITPPLYFGMVNKKYWKASITISIYLFMWIMLF